MISPFSEGTILVVDDQPERAAALIKALGGQQWQFDVRSEVPDLEAALGAGSVYDCALCSVDLMNVSWASVRRAMRNFDVQVPVIVLADERDVDSMTTALGLGAADFFVRVHERPGLLTRSIERSVHHRRLQRQLEESKRNLENANARLRHSIRILEQDQQAGRQVQMAMLPAAPVKAADYWFSHVIFTSLYLSGDFTDYFQVGDDTVVFFLADVSGHGSSSAFATVLLKNLFARKRSDFLRRDDESIVSPPQMLALANQELLELELNKYATMVVGTLNFKDNTLRYSVAGHLPLPVILHDKGINYLEGSGPPVGLMPNAEYNEQHAQLPKRFLMSVFSDGILELIEGADLLEKETELMNRLAGPVDKPSVVFERLAMDHVNSNELPDDVAALVISRGLS